MCGNNNNNNNNGVCPNPEIHTTYYIPLPFLQAREVKNNLHICCLFVFNYVYFFSHFFFIFFSRTLLCSVPVSLNIILPCSSGNGVVFEPAQSDTVFIRRHIHVASLRRKGNTPAKASVVASSMEIIRQFYPVEMTSTRYTRLYEANSVYSTRRSRQETDFSPLGKKQPIMRIEYRLFDRGWVRSAMNGDQKVRKYLFSKIFYGR